MDKTAWSQSHCDGHSDGRGPCCYVYVAYVIGKILLTSGIRCGESADNLVMFESINNESMISRVTFNDECLAYKAIRSGIQWRRVSHCDNNIPQLMYCTARAHMLHCYTS